MYPISIPFSNTGAHHGIFNILTKKFKIDLLAEKYVNLSLSTIYTGHLSALVNHGTDHCQSTSDGSSTYIQISFLKGYIYPTGYTLKGLVGYCFARSWNVYGIKEGDEENKEKWVILGSNDNTQSTYCNIVASDGNCANADVGSFALKPLKYTRGFKHMRWTSTEKSCFLTTGLDIYGTLSLSQFIRKASCHFGHCYNDKTMLLSILMFIIHSINVCEYYF